MAKTSKPNNEDEVLDCMKKYCLSKGYSFSDVKLKYMAAACYLLYESKGWCGAKYWPPLAMKWVLNEWTKFGKEVSNCKKPKVHKGKRVRQIIIDQEDGKD